MSEPDTGPFIGGDESNDFVGLRAGREHVELSRQRSVTTHGVRLGEMTLLIGHAHLPIPFLFERQRIEAKGSLP